MSQTKKTKIKSVKHPKDCSDKDCVCGGHSTNDVKKNKNHNSTKQKLNHKKEARALFIAGDLTSLMNFVDKEKKNE